MGFKQDPQSPIGEDNQRKRPREVELLRLRKKRQSVREDSGRILHQGAASLISTSQRSHIMHWIEEKVWPKELFQADNIIHALARKKTLRRKRSDTSFNTTITPSSQKTEKNAAYRDPSYEAQLEREAGSFMNEYEIGITESSEKLCQSLLDKEQALPENSIFRDDIFRTTCQMLRGKNEARILKDLTPMFVPSIESLAMLSAKEHLDAAVESVNEGWNNSVPLTKPRPQPDYAVGFRRSAFSEAQLAKLQPFVGDNASYASLFMGTHYMYFPFLTCEVKCGAIGLDVADRQNLHSMTLAVRGLVELFRLVDRAEELHREVLAFSVSHDHASVRIYAHFPVILGGETTYWRHPLRKFDFTEQKGRERWTAYTFTKNLYDLFMPALLGRICSAVDDLPIEIPRASSEPQPSKYSGGEER